MREGKINNREREEGKWNLIEGERRKQDKGVEWIRKYNVDYCQN